MCLGTHLYKTHLDEVHDHVPLTAVTDEVPREVVDQPIIDGLIGELDSVLQEVVALVELIPEEQVRL